MLKMMLVGTSKSSQITLWDIQINLMEVIGGRSLLRTEDSSSKICIMHRLSKIWSSDSKQRSQLQDKLICKPTMANGIVIRCVHPWSINQD